MCLSGTKCSKALNLHLSLIGQSQVSLGSVSGQSQVSLRLVSGQSQAHVSHRSLCAYFVRQTEPKILRLVNLVNPENLLDLFTVDVAGRRLISVLKLNHKR